MNEFNITKEQNGFTVRGSVSYGIVASAHVFYTLNEAIGFIAEQFEIGLDERPDTKKE